MNHEKSYSRDNRETQHLLKSFPKGTAIAVFSVIFSIIFFFIVFISARQIPTKIIGEFEIYENRPINGVVLKTTIEGTAISNLKSIRGDAIIFYNRNYEEYSPIELDSLFLVGNKLYLLTKENNIRKNSGEVAITVGSETLAKKIINSFFKRN